MSDCSLVELCRQPRLPGGDHYLVSRLKLRIKGITYRHLQERPVDTEALLDTELQQIPGLVLGQLDNGLRYVILPNKVPPNRVEAHLEMHVGGS